MNNEAIIEKLLRIEDEHILDTPLDQLDLSTKVYRSLRRSRVRTVRDVTYIWSHNLQVRNIGERAHGEILSALQEWSRSLPNFPGPAPAEDQAENQIEVPGCESDLQSPIPIEALDLSPRTYRLLKRNKIDTVGEIVQGWHKIASLRHVGLKTLHEIHTALGTAQPSGLYPSDSRPSVRAGSLANIGWPSMTGESALLAVDGDHSNDGPRTTKRHRLYEIDLERRTALCTACGYTEIYVKEDRTQGTSKAYCANRWEEMEQKRQERLLERRGQQPSRKLLHRLSEIDPEGMTAICAVCGPTEILKRTLKGRLTYLCLRRVRASNRKYMRARYVSRRSGGKFHLLFQIDEGQETAVCSLCGPVSTYVWQDKRQIVRRCSNATVNHSRGAREVRRTKNTDAINRHKVQHGCKRCGFNENIQLLSLYGGHPEKKELSLDELQMLAPAELKEVLNGCAVYCANCRSFANYDLFLENLREAVDY